MKKITYKFSQSSTDFYFGGSFNRIKKIAGPSSGYIIITDENVLRAHAAKFKGYNTIALKAGEEYKVQATADAVIEQLVKMKADRSSIIIAVGGGVVTDIAGYVASIYMRGLRFGFVPTSILGMTDAAIGGKNGVDIGVYKNLVGVIRQPSFILYAPDFLSSLPRKEWINGFAEIIKHGLIKEASIINELEKYSINYYRNNKTAISKLIEKNAKLKARIVQKDEWEKNERRLLNFGHTIGHALENQYELLHGEAVAIGMVGACQISERLTGFNQTERVVRLLEKYGLPAFASFNKKKVIDVLKMDKKRDRKNLNYVLLEKIGKGLVRSMPLGKLERLIVSL